MIRSYKYLKKKDTLSVSIIVNFFKKNAILTDLLLFFFFCFFKHHTQLLLFEKFSYLSSGKTT